MIGAALMLILAVAAVAIYEGYARKLEKLLAATQKDLNDTLDRETGLIRENFALHTTARKPKRRSKRS